MSHNLSSLPAEEYGPFPTKIGELKHALPGYGYAFEGLTDNPNDRELMSRFVEMGPGMEEKEKGVSESAHFKDVVTASKFLAGDKNRQELLEPLRTHAYSNPGSPLRMAALQALSEVDPSAAMILAVEAAQQKKRIDDEMAQTAGKVHSCCGGH